MSFALFLFCVSFCYVLMKALQQKNVIGGHIWFVGPLSYGMAFGEVYGVTAYVSNPDSKLVAAMAIGTGAWAGCVIAMKLHDRMFKAMGRERKV